MPVESIVVDGLYRDSVELMRIASEVQAEYELDDAQALMGTPANKQQLADTNGLDAETVSELTSDELLLTVCGSEDVVSTALDAMHDRLQQRGYSGVEQSTAETTAPQSIAAATDETDPSIALISVPGDYAVREAWQALYAGVDIQLFSDNVGLEAERDLKLAARDRDQLVLGPDCGSTIIDGVPLGFANVVADGPVGLISASGTGLQEVSVLVDRLGSGISHALGVGGRDLSDAIGGIATCQTIELLDADASTDVIVLLSKPPGEAATQSVLDTVKTCSTPVITCLLGNSDDLAGVESAATLTDAALQAVGAVTDGPSPTLTCASEEFQEEAAARLSEFGSERTAIRGLFVGGTLCTEAALLLSDHVDAIASNVGIGEPVSDPLNPAGNAVVDFGADELTTGRPHPMIDPTLRTQQFTQTIQNESVAVVLLDFVLGHGSHADPAEGIVSAIDDCADPPLIVASVCGTDGDPQTRRDQISKLKDAGVHVAASNATAVTEVTAVLQQAAVSEAQ